MQGKIQEKTTVTAHAFTDGQLPRRLATLKKFSEKYSDFITLAGITNQVFKAQLRNSTKGEIPGNGMLDFGVIVRIGRKVLIDEDAYFRWLDAQQKSMVVMKPDHSQKIIDLDSIQLHITLVGTTVSITDSKKRKVEFSAQLIPEIQGTLQDIEKKYYRSLSDE